MFCKPTPKNTLTHRNERTAPLDCSAVKTGTAAGALWLGLIALLTLISASNGTFADDMVGQASVIDGDTLEVHSTRIRLWGIDAPESTQLCRGEDSDPYRCGAQAANDLDTFIARRPVSCNPINLDRYGRTVARCSVGGADLGEWLVRKGLAVDWPQYSLGRQCPAYSRTTRRQ